MHLPLRRGRNKVRIRVRGVPVPSGPSRRPASTWPFSLLMMAITATRGCSPLHAMLIYKQKELCCMRGIDYRRIGLVILVLVAIFRAINDI